MTPEAGPPDLLFPRGFPGDRAAVRRLAVQVKIHVTGGRPFACKLTTDAELQALNRDFLGHDEPTDVLSFPSGSPQGQVGELAISLDRAREVSSRYGHTVEEEIGVLMLHGVLHLMGEDHTSDGGRMRRFEKQLRKKLGLPAGLIERTGARRVDR